MSQHINLFQSGFRKQRKPFAARTMAPALGVVLGGCAAVYAFAVYQTHAAEEFAQTYAQQVSLQQKQVAELAGKLAPAAGSKALAGELARLEQEVQARRSVLDALGTGRFGDTAGFSEYFAGFGRRAMPGVWLVGVQVTEAGEQLHVHGRALKPDLVPAYLEGLGAESVMEGRRVTQLKLAARAATEAAGKSIPGSGSRAATPRRYVEFEFSAPRHAPAPAAEAGKAGQR